MDKEVLSVDSKLDLLANAVSMLIHHEQKDLKRLRELFDIVQKLEARMSLLEDK